MEIIETGIVDWDERYIWVQDSHRDPFEQINRNTIGIKKQLKLVACDECAYKLFYNPCKEATDLHNMLWVL